MESFLEKIPTFLEKIHWLYHLIMLLILVAGAFFLNKFLTNKFGAYSFSSKRLGFLLAALILNYYSLNRIYSLKYFSNSTDRILTILSVAMTFTCFLLTMYYNCLATNVLYGVLITIIQINTIYFAAILSINTVVIFIVLVVILIAISILGSRGRKKSNYANEIKYYYE